MFVITRKVAIDVECGGVGMIRGQKLGVGGRELKYEWAKATDQWAHAL